MTEESKLTQKQKNHALHVLAATLLNTRTPHSEIINRLVKEGMSRKKATAIVASLAQARSQAMREAGRRRMIMGGLVAGVGLLIVIANLTAIRESSSMFIAYGALLYGGFLLVRGWLQYNG